MAAMALLTNTAGNYSGRGLVAESRYGEIENVVSKVKMVYTHINVVTVKSLNHFAHCLQRISVVLALPFPLPFLFYSIFI